ncbi:hypothetical protein GCM10010464_29010 [Pseudonocardia yunnanensis]|uniref:Polysaccharide pyruvyl transferase domain-containing protein n=1 Tax=Pseudonocardia yunnanensis TaxID=58107 RepID=A0ABW4EYU9_9PSEU
MDHLDLVVGMRLHFLIFAGMKGVPFLPGALCRQGLRLRLRHGSSRAGGVARNHARPLLADIDRLWDERPVRMGVLQEQVAALTARQRRHGSGSGSCWTSSTRNRWSRRSGRAGGPDATAAGA